METTTDGHLIRDKDLLAELALCGHNGATDLTADMLVHHVAELLQRYLLLPWGLIAATDQHKVYAVASWAVSEEQRDQIVKGNGHSGGVTGHYYRLRAGSVDVGYLVLAPMHGSAPIDPTLYDALMAQIGLLLYSQRSRTQQRHVGVTEPSKTVTLMHMQNLSHQLYAAPSLDAALTTILDGVTALMDISGIKICLYDQHTQHTHVVAQSGLDLTRISLYDELTQQIVEHRHTLYLPDIQRDLPILFDSPLTATHIPVRAYLGLPIQLDNDLIGVLELANTQPDVFTEDHKHLLEILVSQLAHKIVNTYRQQARHESLQIRMSQLRAVQRISSQLTVTLFQEEVLAFVLEQAIQATPASHGLIVLRPSDLANEDTSPQSYTVIAAAGYNRDERAQLVQHQVDKRLITATTAIQRGEPILTNELTDNERAATHYADAQSVFAVPIFYAAGVIGAVVLITSEVRGFDTDTLEFMRVVADQAAVAIGNAQRYEEQVNQQKRSQQREKLLKSVLEIGYALRADRPLYDLLEQVGYSVVEAANYRTVIFSLADRDDPEVLRAVAGAGIPLRELERIAQSPFPMDLVRRYLDPRFRIGRSYFIPTEAGAIVEQGFDISTLSYFASSPAMDTFANDNGRQHTAYPVDEWQFNDKLIVPLYSTDDRLVGLMAVSDPIDRQRPTTQTTETLEILADQAAIAIENNHLLLAARAQAEQMTALYQVGAAATSTIDLDTLLDRVYQQIVAYLGTPGYFYIASYLPQQEQMCFDLFMHQDTIYERLHKAIVPKGGLTGWLIDHGESLLIRDLSREWEMLPATPTKLDQEVGSWLGVPLRIQNRALGALVIQNFASNAFSKRDEHFLMGLANQLAVAVQNAGLFKEHEQRIAELNVINHIGTITSSTLDLQRMVSQAYACLAQFLPIDIFSTALYHAERGEICLTFAVNDGKQELTKAPHIPIPGSLTEHVIQTRQPIVIPNLALAGDWQPMITAEFANGREQTVAACLGVPLLVSEGEVVGTLIVQSYTPGLYGERELAFLKTVANQLAMGIQTSRLFNDREQQVQKLDILNQVSSSAASTLEIERIHTVMIEAMVQVTSVDQARMIVYDRKTGQAPIASEYIETEVPKHVVIPLIDNPITVWLDQHLCPYMAYDAQHDPLMVRSHDVFRELDIKSIALVPLIKGGAVIGCIGLDFVGRHGYIRQQNLELCQTIANQTVTAMEMHASLPSHKQTLRHCK